MRNIKRGVSLLEILVAMQCTAMLLAMVCQVLPLARRQNRDADQRLGGALLAQSALEEYLAVPLRDWPKDPVSYPEEKQQVRLELLPWGPDSRLRLARVTVLSGDQERYRLETLVADQ